MKYENAEKYRMRLHAQSQHFPAPKDIKQSPDHFLLFSRWVFSFPLRPRNWDKYKMLLLELDNLGQLLD
jgi:hypothetical protein